MSFDTIRQSAEPILRVWSETAGGLPVSFDNVEFDSTKHESYVTAIIEDGQSFRHGISTPGTVCKTLVGVLSMQVFTPRLSGSAKARLYADDIAALFEGVVDNGVVYDVASIVRVGHEQSVYQVNVYIPFELKIN